MLRPLVAWALMEGAEDGLRMSPSKYWLGVFIVSSRFLPNPDMLVVVVLCCIVLPLLEYLSFDMRYVECSMMRCVHSRVK